MIQLALDTVTEYSNAYSQGSILTFQFHTLFLKKNNFLGIEFGVNQYHLNLDKEQIM